jgi:hypothetical protein
MLLRMMVEREWVFVDQGSDEAALNCDNSRILSELDADEVHSELGADLNMLHVPSERSVRHRRWRSVRARVYG